MPEKMKRKSSVPWPSGKRAFQLYARRIMLWPSRNAATENSTGMAGMSVGSADGSTSLRPPDITLLSTLFARIRGR